MTTHKKQIAMDLRCLEVGKWPISKYQDCKWHLVEEFDGTLREAYRRASELEMTNGDGEYRVWKE